MKRIHGVVQHYAWGDTTFLPHLLGVEPDGRPWAELWLGTHPNGPSTLEDGTALDTLTGQLPFLLKVLAASEPLSLQTHPSRLQAIDGHARGSYPDANPKPELLCALTRFEAFCGIRPVDATLALLTEIGATDLARLLRNDGPLGALTALYRGAIDPVPVIAACETIDRPETVWVRRLALRYPADPSVAATLLLNYIALEPGDALRLDAGNLHAYLGGAGVELMMASDNVVRGGLTAKHVDVDDLLEIVDATPLHDPKLPRSSTYHLPGAGVSLARFEPGDEHRASDHELAVDLSGDAWYLAPGDTVTFIVSTFVVIPFVHAG